MAATATSRWGPRFDGIVRWAMNAAFDALEAYNHNQKPPGWVINRATPVPQVEERRLPPGRGKQTAKTCNLGRPPFLRGLRFHIRQLDNSYKYPKNIDLTNAGPHDAPPFAMCGTLPICPRVFLLNSFFVKRNRVFEKLAWSVQYFRQRAEHSCIAAFPDPLAPNPEAQRHGKQLARRQGSRCGH